MRRKTKELDVDFIGEQGAKLTQQEQQAISEFIKQQREKRQKANAKKSTKVPSQKHTTANKV